MNQVPRHTPPHPWSPRMQSAADVRSAYLALEDDITQDIMSTPPGQDRVLVAKLRAAQLQTEAAHKTMWIIHQEEQDTK